jgi:hypothetical protein
VAEGDGVAGQGGHVVEQAAEAVQRRAGVVGVPGGLALGSTTDMPHHPATDDSPIGASQRRHEKW